MVPASPKIYHITHLANLPQMVDEALWSDSERLRRGLDCTIVGMKEIKRRRLEELTVSCHPTTKVGEYVPFYFCARSIMLYLLYRGNHPDISYGGGQGPIVHLEADLHTVIRWAAAKHVRWAFSRTNAGARYTSFVNELDKLGTLDWDAIAANDWTAPTVKEHKQAEFLVEQRFPWKLVERIGVIDETIALNVTEQLVDADHKPEVVVQRNWYY